MKVQNESLLSKMLKHQEGCCVGNNKPLLVSQKDKIDLKCADCQHTLLRPIETVIIKEGEKEILAFGPAPKA